MFSIAEKGYNNFTLPYQKNCNNRIKIFFIYMRKCNIH